MARPAVASEIKCIDSSRYFYIYKLFGDDRQRFATYFQLDARQLPAPGACRAALVSGEIARGDEDAQKLIAIIAQNGGWLDTLYLNSPGGNVNGGLKLAFVTRDFWLKTRVAPPGAAFTFDADFGPPARKMPPDPGRSEFDRWAAAAATRNDGNGRTWCASACTYTLAAGIDRRGIAQVHRPRNAEQSLEKRTISQLSEDLMMRLYKKMDVGDAFMATTRETATQTTSQVVVGRYPRFIEDALLDRCKSDVAQLDDLTALLQFAIGSRGAGLAATRDQEIRGALDRLEMRRQTVSQCVAALHEKERLDAFKRYCPRGCDPSLIAKIEEQFTDLGK